MQTDNRLHPGAHIRCPHCRQWHEVFHAHTEGTDYTLQMLYFMRRADAGADGPAWLYSRSNGEQ